MNDSPVNPPGATSRAISPFCLARNRVESPTPILVAMPSSLVRSTGPGTPSSSGSPMPRSRSRWTQSLITAASKVRLLTIWVACLRLSHIDCTVRSSWMVGWLSG